MEEKTGHKTKRHFLHNLLNKEGDTEIKEFLKNVRRQMEN